MLLNCTNGSSNSHHQRYLTAQVSFSGHENNLVRKENDQARSDGVVTKKRESGPAGGTSATQHVVPTCTLCIVYFLIISTFSQVSLAPTIPGEHKPLLERCNSQTHPNVTDYPMASRRLPQNPEFLKFLKVRDDLISGMV